MKRTSPWFILLFPIAIPAMIVLDYFGYRMIALLVLVALVLTFIFYVYSLFIKFRSLRGAFFSLAEGFCDPGSWSVQHYPYHHTLSGSAGGHRFHYSLLGHDEGSPCQLFLEYPVGRDFLLEADRDPGQSSRDLPPVFGAVLRLPGFRSLKALPRKVSFFSRILGGLAGSGGPGLVLRRQSEDPFSLPALKRDFEIMLGLVGLLSAEERREETEN